MSRGLFCSEMSVGLDVFGDTVTGVGAGIIFSVCARAAIVGTSRPSGWCFAGISGQTLGSVFKGRQSYPLNLIASQKRLSKHFGQSRSKFKCGPLFNRCQ